jgi:hypothetical protein
MKENEQPIPVAELSTAARRDRDRVRVAALAPTKMCPASEVMYQGITMTT